MQRKHTTELGESGRRKPRDLGSQGFTIIELLIVIVIIGILVAIVAVAYTGVTRQAKEASLKSDLKNASTQLSVDLAKTGVYPGTDGVKTDGGSLPKSAGNTLQYTRSGNGTAYCLTATTPGVPAFMVSSDNTAPREGVCSGLCSVNFEWAMLQWFLGHVATGCGPCCRFAI